MHAELRLRQSQGRTQLIYLRLSRIPPQIPFRKAEPRAHRRDQQEGARHGRARSVRQHLHRGPCGRYFERIDHLRQSSLRTHRAFLRAQAQGWKNVVSIGPRELGTFFIQDHAQDSARECIS